MDFSALLNKMFVFIVMMLVGYVGARKKILSKDFAKGLSTLVMNVFLTCSILNSVITEPPDLSGKDLAITMLVLTLILIVSYALSLLCVRLFHLNRDNGALNELSMSVMNNVFIGMPVAQELFGSAGALYCALNCIPFNLILYTYGVWRLKHGKGGGDDGASAMRIKDVLTIPLIATFAALAIFIIQPPVPRVAAEFISTSAAATMPVSMIVIGTTLGNVNLLDTFREKRAYIISFVRLILCPLVFLLLMPILPGNNALLGTAVIIAGCPTAVVVSVLALQYDYDAAYSSKCILMTTVLSMITLPIFAYFLM